MTEKSPGAAFRERVNNGKILPLPGVYDAFSAILASQRFEGIFVSGFSFVASLHGLPDVGFFNWRDAIRFCTRLRSLLPTTHILSDIDDGFGDEVIAAHTVRQMEAHGVSAVMLEDQKRPRRCGHFKGKEVLTVEEYRIKLKAVLDARKDLVVVARTDVTDPLDGLERARHYADLGADAVMVEAVRDLSLVEKVANAVACPVMVNQLHGGKSPDWSLDEMANAGAKIVIYSTPCLFAAQYAVQNYLDHLAQTGRLSSEGTVTLDECNAVLDAFADRAYSPLGPAE